MPSSNGFLLVVAFAILFIAHGQGLPPEFTRWYVHVVNGLSNGRTLFVHCNSKDDDLGGRNLDPETDFNWSFRQHVLRRTLFWCYVSKDGAHASFKVFWQDVLLFHKCAWKDCIWIAKDDGVYIKDLARNTDEFRRRWKP
ncbi:26S protease regulatory complex subunit 4 family protein [Hibiscus syriacus]|uniref:S-protein homolog n=1 Tax=Hibiscus syriacus TaxID=106335 RepID=A0A6A2XFC4_HIBSY|nr:S-protein homolog 1-like [Hibiscus syriacus]KAE8660776.1 26S protease regulatory complex subunit 4 family protein [Hibiscus syriacus]